MRADITLTEGDAIYWRHTPKPRSILVGDDTVCSVSNPPPNEGFNDGTKVLLGVAPGFTELRLVYDGAEDHTIIVQTQRADNIVLPQINIVGPQTIEIGKTAYFNCDVVGGRYTNITSYDWSCLGTGQTGSNAYVDTTGRMEGVYQLCCTVSLELLDGERVFTRTAAGSIMIHIEEPD